MTLPNFLGIGVQRAGTTWLHNMLDSHPQIYMPSRRKEIRFFEKYYDRGQDWYEEFFPSSEEAIKYRAVGEISTQYYYCDSCPERIFQMLPESKLIIILRHPVKRAYSHYGFVVQRRNFKGSFDDFLASRPKSLEKGFYSRYLQRYLQYFEKTRILALLFENIFNDVLETQGKLADFLDVEVEKFPSSGIHRKVNASSIPKFQFLYGFVVKKGRQLRRHKLEPVVDFVMRLGVQRYLAKGPSLPALEKDKEIFLTKYFHDDIEDLEESFQIDLRYWKQ